MDRRYAPSDTITQTVEHMRSNLAASRDRYLQFRDQWQPLRPSGYADMVKNDTQLDFRVGRNTRPIHDAMMHAKAEMEHWADYLRYYEKRAHQEPRRLSTGDPGTAWMPDRRLPREPGEEG
jgi:hypothetical protein